MSFSPTPVHPDEVFLSLTSLRSDVNLGDDPSRICNLEMIIDQLRSKTYEIHRQKPDHSADNSSRFLTIYVNGDGDVNKQVGDYIPRLIEFLEMELAQAKESQAFSREG